MKRLTYILSKTGLSQKLAGGLAIYFSSTVVSKALPFLILPVLTNYLEPVEYGTLTIYQVMISFSSSVVGMNMQSNITRNFFNKSKEYLGKLVFNMNVLLLLSSVLFTLFISVYVLMDGYLFSVPKRWIYVLPLIAVWNMINEMNLSILRNENSYLTVGIFEVSRTALDLLVTLVFLIYFLFGWESKAIGWLLGGIGIGIFSLYRMYRNDYFKFIFDYKLAKEVIFISLPLIFHSLGNSVVTMSDRVFIEKMISASAAGIYSVAYQFGMIVSILIEIINRLWSPWVFKQLAKGSLQCKIRVVKSSFLLSLCYVAISLIVAAASMAIFPFIIDPKFHDGRDLIFWVAISYAFRGLYTLVFPYPIHVGKTVFLSTVTVMTALINLLANYILISRYGVFGAVMATLLSYLFMFLATWAFSQKCYPMPWFYFLSKPKS